MNPFIVLEAKRVVPDAFALVLAAAARTRALRDGAEPRVDAGTAPGPHLALSEIAAGAFAIEELAPFLLDTGGTPLLAPPKSHREIGHGGWSATEPAPAGGTVH